MPGRKPRISWLPAPRPGAELEPAVGEVVEHGHPLGHLGRVVDLRQRVEDARAEVDPLGGVGQVAEHDVVGRQVGVLVEEVVLGRPDVLEPGLVGGHDRGQLVLEGVVLGVRVAVSAELGHVPLDEQAELHDPLPCRLNGRRTPRKAGAVPLAMTQHTQ